MKTGQHRWRRRLLAIAGALALFATACGGGQSADDAAASEAAAANASQAQASSDLSATELLNTASGELVSLDDVIDGDRAVLLWYWAPH